MLICVEVFHSAYSLPTLKYPLSALLLWASRMTCKVSVKAAGLSMLIFSLIWVSPLGRVLYYRVTENLVGFLIIWSKLSDIFGRKLITNTAIFIFIVFSGGCGAAQTTTQL